MTLRADFSKLEIVHTDEMPWVASPAAGVERKRLELYGPAEAGRVTSVVRYAPGSRFTSHPHPDGEEILVLDGVFSDENGDHRAGCYMLNPEGFSHAPYSEEGCVLFVKLRQYPGQREQLERPADNAGWEPTPIRGVDRRLLYHSPPHPEEMQLVRAQAGATLPAHVPPGGEELFVIEGTCYDSFGRYRTGSWVRSPAGMQRQLATDHGFTAYIKRGHLT